MAGEPVACLYRRVIFRVSRQKMLGDGSSIAPSAIIYPKASGGIFLTRGMGINYSVFDNTIYQRTHEIHHQ